MTNSASSAGFGGGLAAVTPETPALSIALGTIVSPFVPRLSSRVAPLEDEDFILRSCECH